MADAERSYRTGKEHYEFFAPMTDEEMLRMQYGMTPKRRRMYMATIYGLEGGRYAALMYAAWETRNGIVRKGRAKREKVVTRGEHDPSKAPLAEVVPVRHEVHQGGIDGDDAWPEEGSRSDPRVLSPQGSRAPTDLSLSGDGVPDAPPEDNVRYCVDLHQPCPQPCRRCLRCLCAYRADALDCDPCQRLKNKERMRTRFGKPK